MICRMINDGRGCVKFHPTEGCSVYSRGGMRARTRMGYCPIPDAGPNKEVHVVQGAKIRAGQQKHKKA